MKKVCFFSGDITRNGGTERIAAMLANQLVKQDKYEICFLSLVEQAEAPFYELDSRIWRKTLGTRWISPGAGYLPLIPRLRKFLKKNQIGIIIDIDIVLDVLSIPATRGIGVKVISWSHFSYEFEQSSVYRRWILKGSLRWADAIVTLTQENREHMLTHTKRPEAVLVIYNPIQKQRPDSKAEREPTLITVGRLVPVKGPEYLAEVAKIVLRRHPDWKWLVLGDGEERQFLEEKIAENALWGKLILTGTVQEVEPYLEKASIYVMTSRTEGLPMSLLEAKACGLPCVSFSINGARELIADGINGYLVTPFDCGEMAQKIDWLIEDEKQRAAFMRESKRGMEAFQMSYVLKQWNELLEQI